METILAFGLLIGLILGGMWVQFAVAGAGLTYIWLLKGFGGWKALGLVSWGAANSFTLAAIPLFVLMAEILLGSGLSTRLYNGVAPFMRRLPGGLLHTNIAGSGIFAAISGGSAPTAAAMSTVALPELSARGYNKRLVAGSLAAGGTLGILIPPSIAMIIYAYATALSGIGEDLVGMLEEANVSRLTFLLIIMVVFAILGCFMEGLGMIAIIVPVTFPALMAMDVDPIWFGVFVVILVELGQLTPPLGVILFVVASSSDQVKVEDVIMGTLPFFFIIVAFILLLIGVPDIALMLPEFTFA